MSLTFGAGLVGLLFEPIATAQEAGAPALTLDAHGPVLPPGGPDAPLTLWSPEARPARAWGLGVQLEEVEGALFLQQGDVTVPALTHLVGANFGGSYQIARRLGVAAALPVWLARGVGDLNGVHAAGPATGDLFIWAPIGIAGINNPEGKGVGLQLIPKLGLPTGNAQAHLGSSGITAGLSLAPGVHFGPGWATAELGLEGSPPLDASAEQRFGGAQVRAGGSLGTHIEIGERLAVDFHLDLAGFLGDLDLCDDRERRKQT